MGDVFEATRPAAARIADPALLQIPRRNSPGGKRSAEMTGMRQVILCAPKASMNVHGDRKWPIAFGQAEIAELVGVGPISKPHVSSRRREAKNLFRHRLSFLSYVEAIGCSALEFARARPTARVLTISLLTFP